jgi:hypothetical protein
MKDLWQRLVASIVCIGIAGIPTWLFLAAKAMTNPEGFWQKIVLGGLFVYLGGGLQLILLIVLCIFLYFIWNE